MPTAKCPDRGAVSVSILSSKNFRIGDGLSGRYRSGADGAQAVVSEIQALGRRAVALQLDVADVASSPAFVERVRSVLKGTWRRDRFDHLVNNAGHGEMTAFVETTEAHPGGASGRSQRGHQMGSVPRRLPLLGLIRTRPRPRP